MSRRRRRLSADEAELWSRVVQSASRLTSDLDSGNAPDPMAPVLAPKPAPLADPPPDPAARLKLPARPEPKRGRGSVTFDLGPTVGEHLAGRPLSMDQKTFTRMKRGRLRPEARLDLHGMTQDAAHGELLRFIFAAHGQGRRLVLVITGKGPGPAMSGILRSRVPHWLSLPPLAPLVMQVTQAHQSHGGAGAIYVYLRRKR